MLRFVKGIYLWLIGASAAPPRERKEARQGATESGAPLTPATLEAMLTSLAYEPTKVSNDMFSVAIVRDNWKISLDVSISPNGENIWISDHFGVLYQIVRAPAAAFL